LSTPEDANAIIHSPSRPRRGLFARLAKQAPVFITRDSLDPIRIVGLEDMMVDAVKFKYIPAPLSTEQLAALVQVPR
jgi:hypothetical protein